MKESEQTEIFGQWVARYGGVVGRVARAFTAREADCQDLVQECWLELWRSIPRFEGRASASTWIYRVALNTALSWQRKERFHGQCQPLEETAEPAHEKPKGGNEERIERLYAAIRGLPKADAALVLLYLEELSYREMAEVLGISESNVGVKLNRARKALALLLKEVVA